MGRGIRGYMDGRGADKGREGTAGRVCGSAEVALEEQVVRRVPHGTAQHSAGRRGRDLLPQLPGTELPGASESVVK